MIRPQLALIFTLLCLSFVTALASADEKRPNIVLVVADDMGWNDTGYSGNKVVKTPHLDDLASKGVRFDYFYAAQQMCSPGRFALMTGRNPFRTGLYQLGSMRPQEITIPKALKTIGYQTAHFGKWHLGETTTSPVKMGFDQAIWKLNFFDLGENLKVGDTKETVPLEGDTSVATMNLALDFVRKQAAAKEPFFVQVCFGSPHSPHRATEEFKSLYQDVPENRRDFLGELSGVDTAVGNLRSELKKLGVADNTIVWFTSDNGGITPFSKDAAGLGKMTIGARTVACMEWPARITKPVQTSFRCGQWDLYPTILDIVGVTMPNQPPLDGISLMPLLEGKMAERPKPIGFMLLAQQAGGRKKRDGKEGEDDKKKDKKTAGLANVDFITETRGVWIDGAYKLSIAPAGAEKRPGITLVDIVADPAEKENLADKHPEIVERMQVDLNRWRTSVRASFDGKDY